MNRSAESQEELDRKMMRRCIELASQASGRSSPNPLVGAVLVDDGGNVIAEGYHEKAGQAHAEVLALETAAGEAAGATLYVNLEPCSHFGRTPPCADRVIASGVKRVVIGMQDPNPQVNGQGSAKLAAAGIEVAYSSLKSECEELNRAFKKHITTGLPWLALKIAATLDGRIADRNGKSRWISGPESRQFVQELRNTYDCVLVGAETAVTDDPMLNVRGIENGRDPHRAVLDSRLRCLPSARIFQHQENSQSWTAVFCLPQYLSKAQNYGERVQLIPVNSDSAANSVEQALDQSSKSKTGLDLKQVLSWLGSRGVLSVLCEGGGRLAASLLEQALVDELIWIIAPKLLIDASAKQALQGSSLVEIQDALLIENGKFGQLGSDLLFQARLNVDRSG